MRKHLRKFLPDHEAIRANRWLAPFENTLLHPRLWHLNRHSAAGGAAVVVDKPTALFRLEESFVPATYRSAHAPSFPVTLIESPAW